MEDSPAVQGEGDMKLVIVLLSLALASLATGGKRCFGNHLEDEVLISFHITQAPSVYERSAFGEPPQIGVWIQDAETGETRTVYVTQKTGTGNFEGKVGVPVALPAWVMAYRAESNRTDFPTMRHPVADAITGPTRREVTVEVQTSVSRGSRWHYFVEVNVAGDYNHAFPHFHQDGQFDPDGNGQPSLVYRGEIVALPGESNTPELFGRTEQVFFADTIVTDLTGLTTARELLSSIVVTCGE